MNNLIDILVEKAIQHEDFERFVNAVHENVILPGFDEALFIRLYREATPSARMKAARLLRRQVQLDAFPA